MRFDRQADSAYGGRTSKKSLEMPHTVWILVNQATEKVQFKNGCVYNWAVELIILQVSPQRVDQSIMPTREDRP